IVKQGHHHNVASVQASEEVLAQALQRVAIPKRFSLPMREIWQLQPRFELRKSSQARRLLTHPRFRAAYDFLLLRADESPELAQLGGWWTQAQTVGHDALATQLGTLAPTQADAADAEAVVDTADAPKKRPRRRRRRTDVSAGAPPTAE
ncbi:MAG: polynucleotide adenylyltransferase PcnB, partial [Rudaea sp.]